MTMRKEIRKARSFLWRLGHPVKGMGGAEWLVEIHHLKSRFLQCRFLYYQTAKKTKQTPTIT